MSIRKMFDGLFAKIQEVVKCQYALNDEIVDIVEKGKEQRIVKEDAIHFERNKETHLNSDKNLDENKLNSIELALYNARSYGEFQHTVFLQTNLGFDDWKDIIGYLNEIYNRVIPYSLLDVKCDNADKVDKAKYLQRVIGQYRELIAKDHNAESFYGKVYIYA